MTALDDYLFTFHSYVCDLRRWEDVCRQIMDADGTAEERRLMVDEACRLAIQVSDGADSLSEIAREVVSEAEDDPDRDDGFLNEVAVAVRSSEEDAARADSFVREVTNLRLGGSARRPRKPKVANPFIPLADDDIEVVHIDPESLRGSEDRDGASETDMGEDSGEDSPGSDSAEVREDGLGKNVPEESVHESADEGSETSDEEPEATASDECSEGRSGNTGVKASNPLAEETQKMLSDTETDGEEE